MQNIRSLQAVIQQRITMSPALAQHGAEKGPDGDYKTSANPAPFCASLETVKQARERISRYGVHLTPVLTCNQLDALSGKQLFFKAEIFQKTGAFKFRGACNAVFSLSDEAAARGVCTHSSGNHAGALALAAKMRGIPAYIVVPRDTPQCKVDAVESYGGKVTKCEPTIDAREAMCAEVQRQTGATLIPPYNHPDVIAGQGTIALEFLEQVPDLDAIVVPVSGGGMISGIAVAAKALRPGIRIIAAEPCGRQGDAADVAKCKAEGALVPCARPDTIADGLQGRLGDLTWPIVSDLVDGVVVVSEEEIIAAMKLVFERMKVVVEPSAAVGVAAVWSPQWSTASGPAASTGAGSGQGTAGQVQGVLAGCERVGVILCGGNVSLDKLGTWFAGSS